MFTDSTSIKTLTAFNDNWLAFPDNYYLVVFQMLEKTVQFARQEYPLWLNAKKAHIV